MAQVSMQQVKELRDRTQAGLNDCRSALMESEGDMDKAVDIILKKGLAKSAKRAGAVADFRAWSDELLALCEDARALCLAHPRKAPPPRSEPECV